MKSFGAGLLIFPARHLRRSRWQRLGDRRTGRCAARAGHRGQHAGAVRRRAPRKAARSSSSVPTARCCMTLGTRGGAAAPGFFYQPNDVLVAPNGNIFVSEGHGGANSRILKFSKDGKLHQDVGHEGIGRRPARWPARAGDGFARPAVCRRSRQQPHRDLRPGQDASSAVLAAVQPAERHLHRQARRDLRRRFRVGVSLAQSRWLEARHPHRQRARRVGHRVHSGSGRQGDGDERGGRRRRGRRRQHLRRRGRTEGREEVRPHAVGGAAEPRRRRFRARRTANRICRASGRSATARRTTSRITPPATACRPAAASSTGAPFRTSHGPRRSSRRTSNSRATADPLAQCYLPGVPRIMYMEYPFQIFQTPRRTSR